MRDFIVGLAILGTVLYVGVGATLLVMTLDVARDYVAEVCGR